MKKLTAILTLIIILFSNAGFAVNVHYCKGKVEKIELGYFNYNISCEHQVEKGCCTSEKCTADDAEESCCADETISKQYEEVVVQNISLHAAAFLITPTYEFNPTIYFIPAVKTTACYEKSVQANAPPLYKLYQQFLLYA